MRRSPPSTRWAAEKSWRLPPRNPPRGGSRRRFLVPRKMAGSVGNGTVLTISALIAPVMIRASTGAGCQSRTSISSTPATGVGMPRKQSQRFTIGKRARRQPAPSRKTRLVAKPSTGTECSGPRYTAMAGTTPKDTMSARESRLVPNARSPLSRRATTPSTESRTAARMTRIVARQSWPSMMASSARKPAASAALVIAFAGVKKWRMSLMLRRDNGRARSYRHVRVLPGSPGHPRNPGAAARRCVIRDGSCRCAARRRPAPPAAPSR